MTPLSSEFRYRASAVQEATPPGLIVILYDILVGDLRRAVIAMRSGNVENRCKHLKHSLSVLQVLDGSLDQASGGDAEKSLSCFYSHIRGQILRAQFQNDAEILEQQIALVLSVREAWQVVDSHGAPQCHSNPARPSDVGSAAARILGSGSWSA